MSKSKLLLRFEYLKGVHRKQVDIIYTDFQKAFERIDYYILID